MSTLDWTDTLAALMALVGRHVVVGLSPASDPMRALAVVSGYLQGDFEGRFDHGEADAVVFTLGYDTSAGPLATGTLTLRPPPTFQSASFEMDGAVLVIQSADLNLVVTEGPDARLAVEEDADG